MMAWLADRLGWRDVTGRLAKHRVPRHGFVFYVGSFTLFLFAVQVATGVLLVLYYRPEPDAAFASVQRIAGGEIPYGNLVRNVHAWSSDLFVLSLVVHLFTVLVRRSFRPPHELSWVSGVVALVLGVGLAFTGAILPWSEGAYADALVGSGLARTLPIVGEPLMRFMRGGEDVGAGTLGHAFGFHVAALPAALTLLVATHLYVLSRKPLVPDPPKAGRHKHATSTLEPDVPTIPLYPDFFLRQGVAFTGLTVVLMTLATFADRPLGIAADARAAPIDARPPWYFLPFHEIVRAAPKELLGVSGARFIASAVCLLGALAVALPFIDSRGSKVTAWIAWALGVVLLLLSASALA